MFDELGNRMKAYEKIMQQRFLPLLPIVARIDGKAFHSWTLGLEKPFDQDMIQIMQNTTKRLVEETNACIGYTQSDEISLVFYSENLNSQIFFDGKIFKLNSVLASMATAYFARSIEDKLDEVFNYSFEDDPAIFKEAEKKIDLLMSKPPALFDCRVWQVPTKEEVCNYLIWREADAVRNSIQSAGQAYFSHTSLQGKNQNEIQEMLFQEKNINWNDYSVAEKRGTYFQKKKIKREFTTDEIDKLPEKHHARIYPHFEVERTDIQILNMSRFTQLANRVEVVFDGVEPKYKSISMGACVENSNCELPPAKAGGFLL